MDADSFTYFPDYQRELKTEWIYSSLGSFTATIRSIQFGDDVGTRHRLHLSKSTDPAHYFGLNRLHSQFVEPLHGCPMASDAVANSWAEWESWGKSHNVDHIIVRGNSEGHWVATGFASDQEPVHFGGLSTLTETINGIHYEWPVDSFFQANIPLLSQLTQTVVDLLNPQADEIGLDLCCGVGLFGLPLARQSRSVRGVETSPQSVQFATSNAVKNQITNFLAICQSIDELSITDFDATFAVVDPPRTGLGTRLCDRLNVSSLQRIVYVSCNPDTMARDLDTLTQAFEVTEIIPYDMFPNTIHCEVVALLHRK